MLAQHRELLPGASGEPFVAVDFETASGLRTSACSVAVVRVEGERVVRAETSLIRPPQPSGELFRIHGISEAAQRNAPPLSEVWERFAPFFEGVGLIVAHNAAFDRDVMLKSWGVAGLTPPGLPWACTVEMSKRLWPSLPGHKLNQLAVSWGIPLRHHNALSDARACAELVLRARAVERGELDLPWKKRPDLRAPEPPSSTASPEPSPSSALSPASVLPPRSPVSAEQARCIELLELGREARARGGDVLLLQEEVGNPVARALVSCGWLLEDLEQDLLRLHRRQAEGVRLECRFEALTRVLSLPRNAQPDFFETVRRMRALQRQRRADYGRSTSEQREVLKERTETLEDQVDELLGVLPQGGAE